MISIPGKTSRFWLNRTGGVLKPGPLVRMHTVHALKVSRFGFKNYAYVVVDDATRAAAVIDPAWQPRPILELLAREQTQVQAVLLTHSHLDHVNLARMFAKRFSCPVYVGRAEAEFYGFSSSRLALLDHLSELRIGATQARALWTPGHTAGGICYQFEGDLFTGDTLFAEGCGICSCEGGSAEAMFRSLNLIKESVPGETRVFPGHSYGKEPGQTLNQILQTNIYFQFASVTDFVAFRMRPRQPSPFDFR